MLIFNLITERNEKWKIKLNDTILVVYTSKNIVNDIKKIYCGLSDGKISIIEV